MIEVGEICSKRCQTSQSSHYFLMGCWALKPHYEHTIVMYFGTMNTRAAAKITVRTLLCIHMDLSDHKDILNCSLDLRAQIIGGTTITFCHHTVTKLEQFSNCTNTFCHLNSPSMDNWAVVDPKTLFLSLPT